MSWHRMWTVARTDLKQLLGAKDFWVPMVLLGALFFLVIPTTLLLALTSLSEVDAITRVSETLTALPDSAQKQLRGDTEGARAAYALAVFLFAPVAVVVPLTISTAVGAATLVGERERGTGEFLAHSPATTREIYIGKLIASLVPGYLTTIVGFGLYSLMVNLVVGPDVGGWFFPTVEWWILMTWVIPPFLAVALSIVLRLSARLRSTAAAQQASGLVSLPLIGIAYSQSAGALVGGPSPFLVGLFAWVLAAIALATGVRSVRRARLLGVADES